MFQTPITIEQALQKVQARHYVLPAIQREFVWSAAQIERLFDSIMRGYPIGSFLFWRVERERSRDYQFYDFIRDYDQRAGTHNSKAAVTGSDELTAVLDGQQRLTALYVGFYGTYAYKVKWRRWSSPDAFPKRRLHLNLAAPADDGDRKFEFRFITDEEAKAADGKIWFLVGDVLALGSLQQLTQRLKKMGLGDHEHAGLALHTLWEKVRAPLISHYMELEQDLDKVLNIFIRINSGGTPLSYSDLLLSIATAQWSKRDARKEIHGLVDRLNALDFNFDKDFVLKSCLVLSDVSDVAFKVNNFNATNMAKIEDGWPDIARALQEAVALARSFGFNRHTLTSNNALIPIAYYLKKRGFPNGYAELPAHAQDRDRVRHWLLMSLLTSAFGGQPDRLLRQLRAGLKGATGAFPYADLAREMADLKKPLKLSDEDLEGFLWLKYNQAETFAVLALLFPHLDFRNHFHQDHIFARSTFTRAKLTKLGVPASQIDEFIENADYLGNLQLLDGKMNESKSKTPFGDWITATYPKATDRNAYQERHGIPPKDHDFPSFLAFLGEREKLLIERLKELTRPPT